MSKKCQKTSFWHVLTRNIARNWRFHYFLTRFDTFWHVFDTFLKLFWHVLTRDYFLTRFDTYWHVLTLLKNIVFSCIFIIFWHVLTRFDTFWPGWVGSARRWYTFWGSWSVKKYVFDTFWHVLTRNIKRKRWFCFLTRGRVQTFFDTRIFLTRFDTNLNTYGARAQVSKNSVKKCQKISFLTRFDTFWHECEHLWGQSRVFGFWHVLTRGGCQ